ncbi:MAG: hypothetical protein HN849_23990, partial [Victivallales bacterium]|nr:hypothetical protein [Victivallales bacterium]
GLVASFRSTLEVASGADALLTVADAGDPYVREHLQVVRETLAEIGAGDVPSLLLLNKSDSPTAQEALPELRTEFPDALVISALTGTGLPALRERVARLLGRQAALPTPSEECITSSP